MIRGRDCGISERASIEDMRCKGFRAVVGGEYFRRLGLRAYSRPVKAPKPAFEGGGGKNDALQVWVGTSPISRRPKFFAPEFFPTVGGALDA